MEYVFHKIKSIGLVGETTLIAQFEDGICKEYDVKQIIKKFPSFEKLINDRELFKKVHVEGSGFGIVWNDEFDLSCNEIWDNGTSVKTPFDSLIGMSDATELWNLNESTLRKAISYGKLKVGYDACNYGKQWVVTKKAMLREYGNIEQFPVEGLCAAGKNEEYKAESKKNNEQLAMLIHDFKCTDPKDMYFDVLRNAMEKTLEELTNPLDRDRNKELGEYVMEYEKRARAEGIKEGKAEVAKAMLQNGIDPDTISKCTSIPVDELKKL